MNLQPDTTSKRAKSLNLNFFFSCPLAYLKSCWAGHEQVCCLLQTVGHLHFNVRIWFRKCCNIYLYQALQLELSHIASSHTSLFFGNQCNIFFSHSFSHLSLLYLGYIFFLRVWCSTAIKSKEQFFYSSDKLIPWYMVKEWMYITVSLWQLGVLEKLDSKTYIKVTLSLEDSRK